MNELDKVIGQLKGWRFIPAGTGIFPNTLYGQNPEGFIESTLKGDYFHSSLNCQWSTSDAKAFELVDELIFEANNRMWFFDFGIALSSRKPWGWTAYFTPAPGWHPPLRFIKGDGPTRPEAICRAYIAAREWIATATIETAWRKGEEAKDATLKAEMRDSARKFDEGQDGMATKAGA